MNQIATQQPKIPMSSVGVSDTGKGSKIAPKDLNEVVKFAEVMARADIALPKHLRNNPGACMAVAMQALEWELSPFAVASKSYTVNGAIAYEAQLIAAVVNTRSGIKGRLKYRYEGEGGAMTCTVTGILDNEECIYTSPAIGSITTKNSPLWKSDPQQQLGYFSARSWARRHCPEVILGVYDRDEAEEFRGPDKAKDITDRVIVDPLSDEPITPKRREVEFDQPFDAETGEIIDNSDPGDGIPSSSPDAGEDASSTAPEPGEDPPQTPSSGSEQSPELWLLNVARMLWAATNFNGDMDILKNQRKSAQISFPKPDNCPKLIADKANSAFNVCEQVVGGSIEPDDGLALVAGIAMADQDEILRKAGAELEAIR